MYTYTNSKLMRANFLAVLGLRVQQYAYTANTRNDVALKIRRTAGGATLADFFVASRRRSTTTPTSPLREIVSRSQPSIIELV